MSGFDAILRAARESIRENVGKVNAEDVMDNLPTSSRNLTEEVDLTKKVNSTNNIVENTIVKNDTVEDLQQKELEDIFYSDFEEVPTKTPQQELKELSKKTNIPLNDLKQKIDNSEVLDDSYGQNTQHDFLKLQKKLKNTNIEEQPIQYNSKEDYSKVKEYANKYFKFDDFKKMMIETGDEETVDNMIISQVRDLYKNNDMILNELVLDDEFPRVGLDVLSKVEDPFMRLQIAEHENVSIDTLKRLSNDTEPLVSDAAKKILTGLGIATVTGTGLQANELPENIEVSNEKEIIDVVKETFPGDIEKQKEEASKLASKLANKKIELQKLEEEQSKRNNVRQELTNLLNTEPEQTRGYVSDTALSVVTGGLKAVRNTVDLLGTDRDFIRNGILTGLDWAIRKFDSPQTIAGKITEPLAQFLLPFGAVSKGFRIAKGTLGFKTDLAIGAAVDFSVWEKIDPRLSTMLYEDFDFKNAVTDYLRNKEDDSDAEARLKNAIEGAALGGLTGKLIDGIVYSYRGVKNSIHGKYNQEEVNEIIDGHMKVMSEGKTTENITTEEKIVNTKVEIENIEKEQESLMEQIRKDLDFSNNIKEPAKDLTIVKKEVLTSNELVKVQKTKEKMIKNEIVQQKSKELIKTIDEVQTKPELKQIEEEIIDVEVFETNKQIEYKKQQEEVQKQIQEVTKLKSWESYNEKELDNLLKNADTPEKKSKLFKEIDPNGELQAILKEEEEQYAKATAEAKLKSDSFKEGMSEQKAYITPKKPLEAQVEYDQLSDTVIETDLPMYFEEGTDLIKELKGKSPEELTKIKEVLSEEEQSMIDNILKKANKDEVLSEKKGLEDFVKTKSKKKGAAEKVAKNKEILNTTSKSKLKEHIKSKDIQERLSAALNKNTDIEDIKEAMKTENSEKVKNAIKIRLKEEEKIMSGEKGKLSNIKNIVKQVKQVVKDEKVIEDLKMDKELLEDMIKKSDNELMTRGYQVKLDKIIKEIEELDMVIGFGKDGRNIKNIDEAEKLTVQITKRLEKYFNVDETIKKTERKSPDFEELGRECQI